MNIDEKHSLFCLFATVISDTLLPEKLTGILYQTHFEKLSARCQRKLENQPNVLL